MRIPLTLFLILIWAFLIIAPLNAFAEEVKYPYKDFNVKNIYQLDDGKIIYIEQTGWGNTIWEKKNNGKFKKRTFCNSKRILLLGRYRWKPTH